MQVSIRDIHIKDRLRMLDADAKILKKSAMRQMNGGSGIGEMILKQIL